jgi:glycosyltransferase involved in cell wall biosynthesis
LGNHLPRHCGIATFTTDLTAAIVAERADVDCFVVAMNDAGRRHAYPERVRFEITEADLPSYRRAADFLNASHVDVVCVQHEYGIFGGQAGAHLLTLLPALRMPIVTTVHTVLAEPHPPQREVMNELVRLSERVVVMSTHGASLLRSVYDVPENKIELIAHGVPSLPPAGGSKDRLGHQGHSVILTFGLLSPDKGIEYVIDALPAVVARHPEALYIVLGATHPHVKEQQGETYRTMLMRRAEQLGVQPQVVFHDRFVPQEELVEFLSAADIYVTPYLNADQITSGTLAYAVGSGKAVISTPYHYARELLAEGRGVLVPARNAGAIAQAAIDLLDDESKRRAFSERARAGRQDMMWPAVAGAYLRAFEDAVGAHASRRRARSRAKTAGRLPDVNLDHLRVMTDDTGVLQHATFGLPRYADGYCLDDNARALLAMVRLESAAREGNAPLVRALAARYLAFVSAAFNPERGRFRNFLSYSRAWTEECGSEDSHGRALWALGAVVGRSGDPGRRRVSGSLFHAALPAVETLSSPRAWAFALLGIDEYLREFEGDRRVQRVREHTAGRLLDILARSSSREWSWYEASLTYCNARLPHALIASGDRMSHGKMVAAGLQSLEWLSSQQRSEEGTFSPIGSNGFFVRGATRARFDQQPIEAAATVAACLEAARVTGDERWEPRARSAFEWYLGQNDLQEPVVDLATGGCHDGLHVDRVNENQGAESTLSFILALTDMQSAGLSSAPPLPRTVG